MSLRQSGRGPTATMALTALTADSSKPTISAIASDALSPVVTVPTTSARAMPMDTAVTATAVDSASAAVVISSTKAMERCPAAQERRCSCSIPLGGVDDLDMSAPRISFRTSRDSRDMSAPIRPDYGEGFDEEGQFYVLG